MENPIPEGSLQRSMQSQGTDQPLTPQKVVDLALKCPSADRCFESTVPPSCQLNGCANSASILLEPSEYFFDDDFAVPFDANLRDEPSFSQQGPNDDSDEGISSSGTVKRGILAPHHSRSDSCLFTQPDSGNCGQDGVDTQGGLRFEPSIIFVGKLSQNASCCPDSTSAPDTARYVTRIHRTASADFSTVLYDMNGIDKLFDNCPITFSELQQPPMHAPSSVTGSWMQTMLEGSCPRLKELLRRTAEALDYRLAWGEIQIGFDDGTFAATGVNSRRIGKIQRSTSHGNIFTTASLTGMRRALANVKIISPKSYRSVGVSTSECGCGESSVPDTTTATATTTWARIRSSRESLSGKKATLCGNATVIPSLLNCTKSNVPESVVTWRAIKEAAGNGLTTWGQLRRTASHATREVQKPSYPKKRTTSSNLHVSLMPPGFDFPLRPSVSQKAMHRYSGTLLEIFMQARARDLISSSCPSSTGTDMTAEEVPCLFRRPRHLFGGDNSSANFSLQTNALLSLDAEVEHTGGAVEKSSETFLRTAISPPKVSQLPCAPVRKSSIGSLRRLFRVNRSGAVCFASRLNPELPDFNLLTMSAGPESECMSRLREASYFNRIRNPRATIVYPVLGKLAIPKPSRIESNTFLSQTLPDLSLLGKAAAQEAKSGTPMTRVPTLSHGSRRSTSLAPMSGRGTGDAVVNCHGSFKNDRTKTESIQQRINYFDANRVFDMPNDTRQNKVLARKLQPQVGVMDRSVSEPDVIDSHRRPPQLSTPDSSARLRMLPPASGNSLCSCRPRLQTGYCKKSVSFNADIHKLPEDISFCRLPDAHRYGSPDAKVIPKHWGLYGQDPPPLAVFQPLNDDINDVSSTTRPSDVDVRYHAMVMDVIRAVQETIAYFCHPALSLATPDGSNITGSSSSGSVTSRPANNQYRCYSSLAALGGSGRSSLVSVVNPLMVLISDGLLPPQTRAIFASKPKSRIWALVEDSCRPSPCLGKIEHHVLNEALNQVKCITGAISEKLRFRAFVCACLNQRALLLWLNSLVSNEALLKRYYCDGAFIRQCRSALQGLYADLTTHVEQLLNYPFNFDLSSEVKRPIGHVYTATPLHASKSDARKVECPKGSQTFGRASSTPACTTKINPKSASRGVRPSSIAKTTDTKMVRPRVQPISRRPPATSDNQNSAESGSPSPVGPLKPVSLPSPSASAMRGKLRTAFSTFRRSTDIVSTVTIKNSPLVAPKCSPPPPPPHRTPVLSNTHIHYDTITMRIFNPPPPF
ncbi:RUN and SH3 domain-containing protein 1 [Taenia crassiceps]|uniref:RUN and SH3 domain-containing protein 1 n=1 Tax=Taenia crassiceps TaxID=6207 RepID=A0ABR4QKH9_9CEST